MKVLLTLFIGISTLINSPRENGYEQYIQEGQFIEATLLKFDDRDNLFHFSNSSSNDISFYASLDILKKYNLYSNLYKGKHFKIKYDVKYEIDRKQRKHKRRIIRDIWLIK